MLKKIFIVKEKLLIREPLDIPEELNIFRVLDLMGLTSVVIGCFVRKRFVTFSDMFVKKHLSLFKMTHQKSRE